MKINKVILTAIALAATTAILSAGDAKENWDKNCKKCHGEDGKGETVMGKKLGLKDLTDAKFQDTFKDADVTKAIKEGIKDGDKTKMKPTEGLTDDEVKDLVAKVRAFKK